MNIDALQAELKQLKDEKYHLLKLINHDIRSPFNRLFALLQLLELESTDLSDQQNEYLDSMYLSILSGLEMIQNLRDMREIDAGNIEITNSEVVLNDLIQGAIRTFSKQCEIKNITISPGSENADIKLITDSYYLQRVIENVLSNSIKFSKEGKEVRINTNVKNSSIQIEIQDSGEGIKSEEEPMLYEKFKKLSSFATGGEGSLGLGLYNSKSFIKMMNGSMEVNRNNQPGACFIITVPITA